MEYGNIDPNEIKYDSFEKAFETTLGAAAQTVDITGLDGDTDEIYVLDIMIVAAGAISAAVTINNDAGANYSSQELVGASAAITAARTAGDNDIRMNSLAQAAGELIKSKLFLRAKSGQIRTGTISGSDKITGTTVAQKYEKGISWNDSGSNITSIKIDALVAAGLDIGSKITLWKKIKAV